MWHRKPTRLAAGLFLSFLLAGSGLADERTAPSPWSSIEYSASGLAIIRALDRKAVELAVATSGDDALSWRRILQLEAADYEAGWRLFDLICDRQVTNACLIERRKAERREVATIDLASSAASDWKQAPDGEILDYDFRAAAALTNTAVDGNGALWVTPMSGEPARMIWQADGTNSNASGRFLTARSGPRPVLLLTGGKSVRWQVVDANDVRSPARLAPGVIVTAFDDALYSLSVAPDGEASWFGRSPLPQGGEWGSDLLIHHGDGGSGPSIISPTAPGRLGSAESGAAFLPGGALVAVVREGGRQSVAELCRRTPEGNLEATPLKALETWLEDSARTSLGGGAPSSRIALVSKTSLSGHRSMKALAVMSPQGSGEAVRPCGETQVAVIDLPLPDDFESLAVTRQTHTVEAADGSVLTYHVLQGPGDGGEVLIRPYGAYGLNPDVFLARPIEQQWVAQGNTLVVPHLRGDAGGLEWIDAGQGDYKRTAATDLIAVTRDILAARPQIDRVSLLGFSAGGFVSARAALNQPELFEHVVLISSVSDLGLSEARHDGSFDQTEFGPATGGFEAWLGGRPAGKSSPDFILLHGTSDSVVPASASASFAAYARRLGYEVKGQLYQGVGHDLANASYILRDVEELW